jgi:hypothetical protein
LDRLEEVNDEWQTALAISHSERKTSGSLDADIAR